MRKNWTEWELQYLEKNWPDQSDEEIAAKLGRSKASVQTMRYKQGICVDPTDWPAEADAYILEHWRKQSPEEMGAAIGKTSHAVYQRGLSLGLFRRSAAEGRRRWTKADNEYLEENWGHVSLKGICKTLGRSEGSVLNQIRRLELGPFLENGDYITLNQLIKAVTGSCTNYSYKMESWVKNRGLPVHKKLVNGSRYRVVYLEEFWKWAEKNRSFLDFSKMEPLILGEEPDWVAEQRRKDFESFALQRKDPWTTAEDSRLIMLLKQHRYGYAELSEMLHRSAGSIQRRCQDLNLKERPIKANNHGKECEWTDRDFSILADGIRRGDSYTAIGLKLGRSEKAVRGKVYFVYLTENADKIRRMLGSGPWGHGAPTPTVKQGYNLSRCRTGVRKDLSALAGLLRYRMNAMGYDPYWQRFMCMNWDDNLGCGAGCADCDSCAEFARIEPQFCGRCGGIFYEREKSRFCSACREARKRQAQRHWARTRGKGPGNEDYQEVMKC